MAAKSNIQPVVLALAPRARDEADTFDSLYELHVDRALRLAMLLCGHREQAEDLAAEAFVKVLSKWRTVPIDNFWAYLRAAIVNEVRSGHRRRDVADRWRHRTHSDYRTTGPDDSVIERDRVSAALAALPQRQRTAIVLRYFEDLPETAAATVMGCSVGTVKSTTARGASRLRQLLSEETT